MQDSILIKTWSALSEPEKKMVEKAVRSPLVNNRPELLRLLNYIESNFSNSKPAVRKKAVALPEKEAAFHYVFATQSKKSINYDDGKMRHLMTYLMDVIKQTFAWKEWQADRDQVNLQLCRFLKKRGFDDLFEKEMQRSRAELEKSDFKTDQYYLKKFNIELEAWEVTRQRKRGGSENLGSINEAFGVYVAINILRQGCTLLAQKSIANIAMEVPFLQETLRLTESGIFKNNLAVEAWYASYKALESPENVHFLKRLKQILETEATIFPDSDLRDFYVLAINVCIRQINAGDKNYIQEAFDLYRGGLHHKVFLENGYLSKFTYRNILSTAMALGEWDWALLYLKEFREFLMPREQENIYNYNLATYYFRSNNYDQALELLPALELKDMLENFDARRMMLRIYFERNEIQALSSLLESFGIYLRRHREGGYHREMYQNLVKFMKKLISIPPNNKPALTKLEETVRKTRYVAEREWLLSVM